MKEVAVVAMEVTPQEMERIIKQREKEAKDAAIKEKATQLAQLINEIKALGGYVMVKRNGKSTYLSPYGVSVDDVYLSCSRFVNITIY